MSSVAVPLKTISSSDLETIEEILLRAAYNDLLVVIGRTIVRMRELSLTEGQNGLESD